MGIARMAKGFLPYSLDQRLLLPPDMRAWLSEGHLALFISDVVEQLDLSAIFATYVKDDARGRAGYHPAMMVKLLVYGYAVGVTSSRKLEKKTAEDVAFRVLSGDQHPDHDSIASFRKRHLSDLGGLFVQVLALCQKAGLVKLGHIAIDGTKMGAITQAPNDKQQLEPMAELVTRNVGKLADVTSADAGYFAEAALERVSAMGTQLLVPPQRQKHGQAAPEFVAAPDAGASRVERMRYELRSEAGRALYKMRKAIVEPVFGQLKAARGLRRFVVRGLENVRAEFLLMALTHNLLKLFRAAPRLVNAAA